MPDGKVIWGKKKFQDLMVRTNSAHLRNEWGVPVVAQWLTNLPRNHEVVGSIPALAQWVKDLVLP